MQSNDNRNESICFQNAMMHAMNYHIHNSGGKPIEIREVIALAKRIALVSLSPNLREEQEKLEQIRDQQLKGK